MKVLHVYKTVLSNSKGGVEVFLDTLCHATAQLRVENSILSLAKNPSELSLSTCKTYKIIQAKQDFFIASTGFSFSAFKKFKYLVENTDIVHYHFPNPFADTLHFACKIKKPTVLTYHSDIIKQKWLFQLYKPLMNKFLGSIDCIIATSPHYFATSKVLQRYAEKVRVIPIGINPKKYPALNTARVDYWKENLPSQFFLFIGAMRYYKGLMVLLEAIKGTSFQLVLAGKGGLEQELKTYVKKYQLKNVHFLGLISDEDKIALLHLCYAFVFPSHLRSEAFGISLIESSANKKALISCEIGTGTSYVNIHQQTGLVVEPSSSEALRIAMQYLLDNPNKTKEFGQNGYLRFKQCFVAERQAISYLNIYNELLGNTEKSCLFKAYKL